MDNIRNGTRNLGNMQKKNTETIYVLGEAGFSDAIPHLDLATISQRKIPCEVGLRLAICFILNKLSNIRSIVNFPTIYIGRPASQQCLSLLIYMCRSCFLPDSSVSHTSSLLMLNTYTPRLHQCVRLAFLQTTEALKKKRSKISLSLLKGNCPSSQRRNLSAMSFGLPSQRDMATCGFVLRCTTLTTTNYGEDRYV